MRRETVGNSLPSFLYLPPIHLTLLVLTSSVPRDFERLSVFTGTKLTNHRLSEIKMPINSEKSGGVTFMKGPTGSPDHHRGMYKHRIRGCGPCCCISLFINRLPNLPASPSLDFLAPILGNEGKSTKSEGMKGCGRVNCSGESDEHHNGRL
jgi:hypothetical protein